MTVSPVSQTDGPASEPPMRGWNWAVIRLAASGTFYLLAVVVMLALAASSDGAQTVAELLGIGEQTAETGIKVVATLAVLAVLDYLCDLFRMYGPDWLYLALAAVNMYLAYAIVTACAVVLAFFVDDVAAYIGDTPDNVRVIAFGVLALYLWFGTTAGADRLRRISVGWALAKNDRAWTGTIANREREIDQELMLANIDQEGVDGVRELAGRLHAIDLLLKDEGIHTRGVDGVAVLALRTTHAEEKQADPVNALP